VAFVANRGFILSLCLGLAGLYQHHQWRTEKRRSGLIWSALFLALAVFANEGGASTLAFILAYALVLEPGPLRRRMLTVLPALLVIVLWWIIYTLANSGVFYVGAYIDPSTEPLPFAREVLPRAMVLLGGQLALVPPDLMLAVKPSLQPEATALYSLPLVAALAVFPRGCAGTKPPCFGSRPCSSRPFQRPRLCRSARISGLWPSEHTD
jgi:hypothetical protein